MNTFISRLAIRGIHTSAIFLALSTFALAASPDAWQQGRVLFERNWPSRNPALRSDGLGPLFNAKSCVACHQQGGIGGGGDSRFNAVSLGIEAIEVHLESGGKVQKEQIAQLLRQLYPSLVRSDGTIASSVPVPHHGGTSEFHQIRNLVWSHVSTIKSAEGGPSDASEARGLTDEPIVIVQDTGNHRLVIRARLFQRNTTSLFGAGLIDTIPAEVIEAQAALQEHHREVSGRVSILRDGTIGRFGWRANVNRLVNFVDRACANELGLETQRMVQGSDPTRPGYQNSDVDISDGQIELISTFVSGLNAPARSIPSERIELHEIRRGESVFVSVGCATCHVPHLGEVDGLYSDLLLHDMGERLYDLDAAEPHVVSQTITKNLTPVVNRRSQFVSYYGSASSIDDFAVKRLGQSGGSRSFALKSPRSSVATEDFIAFMTGNELLVDTFPIRGLNARSKRTVRHVREELGLRRRLSPSNTSQEWRTAPLWGCRDSAPYMHDGRAATLLESIVLHEGESEGSRDRFLKLSFTDRNALLAFLGTLTAPTNAPPERGIKLRQRHQFSRLQINRTLIQEH